MHKKSNQKIVQIVGNFYGTTAAVYNKMYKEHTFKHFPVIVKALDRLLTILDVDPNQKIIFKPIKGNTAGLFFMNSNKVFIDPRVNTFTAVTNIAHELVHAEQFKQGRMTWKPGMDVGQRLWSNGDMYARPGIYGPAKTYADYRKLPWEAEAFGRQDGLARLALGM
jgi:hypothetical protein